VASAASGFLYSSSPTAMCRCDRRSFEANDCNAAGQFSLGYAASENGSLPLPKAPNSRVLESAGGSGKYTAGLSTIPAPNTSGCDSVYLAGADQLVESTLDLRPRRHRVAAAVEEVQHWVDLSYPAGR